MRVPAPRPLRRRSTIVAAALALLATACGSTAATPTPRPEDAWSRAAIELPSDVVDVAPGSSGGMICSPCHAEQASIMTGVASTPDGLLAVGLQLPPSSAIAYRSPDGREWTPEAGLPRGRGHGRARRRRDADHELVVGRRGKAGASWVRAGTDAWRAAPDAPSLAPPTGGTAELRAVTTGPGRIVAAGSRDADLDSRSAAVWTSPDGLDWELAGTGPAFEEAAATGSRTRATVSWSSARPPARRPGHAVAWVLR